MVLKTLNKINNSYHEIVAVITHNDKPHGRKHDLLIETPLATEARNLSLPVYKTDKMEPELVAKLKSLNADLFVVFAFGVIFREDFLKSTNFGGINIHPSLLPKYRGASPIQKAILDGVNKSGVTIQTVKLKVDSGDIILQKQFDIADNDDIISVENKVSDIAANMILKALKKYDFKFKKQDESHASYCKLIKKEDGLINWNSDSVSINNKVRAFVKWPIAHSFIDNKKINIYKSIPVNKFIVISEDLKMWHSENGFINIGERISDNLKPGSLGLSNKHDGIIVKCGKGILIIQELQIEGKKRLNWKEFINGHLDINTKSFEPFI